MYIKSKKIRLDYKKIFIYIMSNIKYTIWYISHRNKNIDNCKMVDMCDTRGEAINRIKNFLMMIYLL